MKVKDKYYRTIWIDPGDNATVQIIDQRRLPHEFVIETVTTVDQMSFAIKDMHVRGAGLIGAAAGYGMYLAALEALSVPAFDAHMRHAADQLKATRPTAVNLGWAVERQLQAIQQGNTDQDKVDIAFKVAADIADEDAAFCKKVGEVGLPLIQELHRRKQGKRINILTHCNAGWLAFVDHGTATSPIYAAFEAGIDVHVWVDETRPRNQGARLTAWELAEHGIPHTVIPDNVGGHLMQNGEVDLVITGADRVTYTGDVANKIGTYLKALSAKDNDIPFYVALPSSTFDWDTRDGMTDIPIEKRDENEVKYIQGKCDGEIKNVLLMPENSPAANYAFDITPGRLITGLITERGICAPNENGILKLFPERGERDKH